MSDRVQYSNAGRIGNQLVGVRMNYIDKISVGLIKSHNRGSSFKIRPSRVLKNKTISICITRWLTINSVTCQPRYSAYSLHSLASIAANMSPQTVSNTVKAISSNSCSFH